MGNVAFADELIDEINATEEAPEDEEDSEDETEAETEDEGEGMKPRDLPHG